MEADVTERPEWLPQNFRDGAALLKSYNEALAKIREQGSRLNARPSWLPEEFADGAALAESHATAQRKIKRLKWKLGRRAGHIDRLMSRIDAMEAELSALRLRVAEQSTPIRATARPFVGSPPLSLVPAPDTYDLAARLVAAANANDWSEVA